MGGVKARPKRRTAHPVARVGVIGCAVLTVSDTRGEGNDPGGDLLCRLLKEAGCRITLRAWARDEIRAIRSALRRGLSQRDTDVVVATGGTGIAPRDRTLEAATPLVERWLPGFGELFRQHSVRQVGTAAWLSQAAAGVARRRLMVFLPGSPRAVELALEQVLLPELEHVVGLLERRSHRE
jgi:molybdenum cofactor biosynthesis protein B